MRPLPVRRLKEPGFHRYDLYTILAIVIMVVPGCALLHGGNPTRLDQADVQHANVPPVRHVHHPDSIRPDLEIGLKELRFQWSSLGNVRGRRPIADQVGFRSFATLWSRELGQRAAETGLGIGDLSEDLQVRVRARAEDDYWNAIVIELHLFSANVHNTLASTPGTQIYLTIDGQTRLRPERIIVGDLEEYEVSGRRIRVFHRPNTLVFERFRDDEDLIRTASRLQLIVAGIEGGERRYEWSITSGRGQPQPES